MRFRPLETLLSVSSKERLLPLPAPLSRLPHRARLLEEERIATLKFTFHWLVTLVIEQIIRVIENKIRIPDQVELASANGEGKKNDKN